MAVRTSWSHTVEQSKHELYLTPGTAAAKNRRCGGCFVLSFPLSQATLAPSSDASQDEPALCGVCADAGSACDVCQSAPVFCAADGQWQSPQLSKCSALFPPATGSPPGSPPRTLQPDVPLLFPSASVPISSPAEAPTSVTL